MPGLQLETHDREKPIILFTGRNNPLINILIDKFKTDFKIAYVADINLPQGSQDFYRIDTKSAYLINNLEEKIEYAVIFPEESRDRNYLQHVFKKLSDDNTRTVVIINVNQLEQFLDIPLEYKRNPNFYFLILGDVYSEKNNLFPESKVARIIKQALVKKTFKLNANDLTSIYPIYLEDAIIGLSQTLLGPSKKEKFFYLYYSSPETYLSAIHILKRIEPDLEVAFIADETKKDNTASHQEITHLVESKMAITPIHLDRYFDGFEKSVENFQGNSDMQEHFEESRIEKTTRSFKSSKKNIKLTLYSIFAAIGIYIFISVLFLALGLLTFKAAVDAFERQDYKSAIEQNKNSQVFLNATSPNIRLSLEAAKLLGATRLVKMYDEFSQASALFTLAAGDLENLKMVPKGLERTTLDNLIADAYYLYFKAQNLKTSTQNKKLTEILSPQLSKMLSIASVLPEAAGYGQEKNYLLLFQNNGELRPTGGFIGSVGLLRIKDGKISDIKINDVYDFDGQLKTHIEPPYIVRWYLQPNLYLRDSNFEPDFQNSASMAASLYNLEGGPKVDGVIAINYEAVKQIIDAVGPIRLTGYNKTITGQNAFDFLQSTIDNNFFPGSTEKRDVLNALYNALLLKIQDNPNDAMLVAKLVPKLAAEKEIMFAFGQSSIQSAFSKAGFAGEYKDTRVPNISILSDFLAINEANIGVNKANITLARKTEYKVNIGKQKLTSTATQTFTNTGDKTYAAFIRFFVPLGSNLTGVRINGIDQKIVPMVTNTKTHEDNRFKASSNLEVEKTQQSDKLVFGFVISVPAKSNQIIEVSYDNGARIPVSPAFNYSLLLMKQPGTGEYPFVLDINYDSSLTPQSVKNAKLSAGNIQIKKNINTDEEFKAEFITK